jgi:hypothetical protein
MKQTRARESRKLVLGVVAAIVALLSVSGWSEASAAPQALTQEEIAEGWIHLFDGETLFGWETHGDCKWKVVDGVLRCDTGTDGWLGTTTAFSDFVLRLDYRISGNGNSGIFYRAGTTAAPWEDGYEMQINDKDEKYPTGSIYGVAAAKHPEGKLVTNVETWQSVEIRVEGDHHQIALNGKPVLDANDGKHVRGVIGLQYHYPEMWIEFRNVRLKPLGLESIDPGPELEGWAIIPGRKSVFAVKDGVLNISNGNGQIETERQWQDFVFQLDIISNGEHLNSGVFFRGDPGKFWSGYESQIRNQWRGDDRTKPVDFGTGGIYNRQPARKVVSSDREWFTKTIVCHGNHMAVWVNGYQVSDFTDTRKRGMNAREQCRLEGGTISLQGHDPSTNLSFRKLRIAEFPKAK